MGLNDQVQTCTRCLRLSRKMGYDFVYRCGRQWSVMRGERVVCQFSTLEEAEPGLERMFASRRGVPSPLNNNVQSTHQTNS